ncbi:MAG: hypothetical protein FJW39_03775 [Acidobacteria bacterium]|nr:hypothetical protein [Acidobacteriota bacterium]
MDERNQKATVSEGDAMRPVIREVIGEFMDLQRAKAEPALKAELAEERKRREHLEQRVNELVAENKRARDRAEEAERSSAIRSELQRLGVQKVDLAFRAVKDEVARSGDGRLVARDAHGEVDMREYLTKFVQDNPELLPPRAAGGSGAALQRGSSPSRPAVDIDRIKPGMDPAEMDRVRREIAEGALQALKGNRD